MLIHDRVHIVHKDQCCKISTIHISYVYVCIYIL
uniref:Uncharacterized protein n=1 Tax=Arundo donax TaxID=35708 RepID=A0A0A9H6R9_ARUDO